METITVSLKELVVQHADGSKIAIPMWLIGAGVLALAGLMLLGLFTALLTIRRLNERADQPAV